MTNILKVEFLKTKHTVVRSLVWLLPLIAILMMTAESIFSAINDGAVELFLVKYVNCSRNWN